jgi:AraC family transcriptional regulator
MATRPEASMTLDAEVRVPLATAQLVRFHVPTPADNILRENETYWLDMCLTPRPPNARACYPDRWGPNRFERIGNVFLHPPRETMKTRSDGGPTQASVLCHLRQESFRQLFEDDLEWTDGRLEAGLDISDVNIRQLLLRLAAELQNPGFASQAMVESMVSQIAIEVGRYCLAIDERPTSGGLAPWRMRLIDERMKEVLEAPTLSELARLCNMSVRQLTRAFRASRGRSIGDHLADCRIDHAKRLLADDRSIKSVAYSLGFSSPSSFSFAFRRATGQTPREFQQRASGPSATQASPADRRVCR